MSGHLVPHLGTWYLVLPHQKQIRLTPARWSWREGIRPTPASWAWREGSRPTPARLRRVGQESRQQGNPPDPDLNPPNPRIPDARHIGGRRESIISKESGNNCGRQIPARCPRTCRGRARFPLARKSVRLPQLRPPNLQILVEPIVERESLPTTTM